jgi:hypothetical protein
MQLGLLRALVLLGGLAIVASILVYPVVDRLIFRRLRTMMGTMEDMSVRLAGGDYSVGSVQRSLRKYEIGGGSSPSSGTSSGWWGTPCPRCRIARSSSCPGRRRAHRCPW